MLPNQPRLPIIPILEGEFGVDGHFLPHFGIVLMFAGFAGFAVIRPSRGSLYS